MPASSEARFGHRVSDCIVASRVWGGWVGVKNCVFVCVCRAIVCVVGSSFRGRVSDCVVASRVWGFGDGC